MKDLRYVQLIYKLIFVGLLLSGIVFGQNTDLSNNGKVFLINSDRLFGKESELQQITEIRKKIGTELQPRKAESERLFNELKFKVDEIRSLRDELTKNSGACVSRSFPSNLEEKFENLRVLNEQLKKYYDETQDLYEKREIELINPIKEKILDSLKQFAKENNYDVILDFAKIESDLICFGADTLDVTDNFIEYYNRKFPIENSIK